MLHMPRAARAQHDVTPLPLVGRARTHILRAHLACGVQLGRALKLPGSAQAVDELRLLLAADLFILTDDVAVEKVSNGVVTRAVKSWIADSERLRQVELLPWVAKQLDAWDAFAPKPRGSPDSKQVQPESKCYT